MSNSVAEAIVKLRLLKAQRAGRVIPIPRETDNDVTQILDALILVLEKAHADK
jgi:hypothetical protein